MNLEGIKQMTKLEERAEKAEAERDKLIGALEEIIPELQSFLCEYCKGCEDAQKKVKKACAILAKVKKQE